MTTRPIQASYFLRQRGFNMIELMIAIAIGGVLLALAIPNMSAYVANTRLTASANDLIATVQYARTEAIRRNQQVVLCRSTAALINDESMADSACVNTNNDNALWNDTWLLYVTPGTADPDALYDSATDEVLKTGTLDGEVDIRALAGNSLIAFAPDGSLNSQEDAPIVVSFCDDRGEDLGRAMTIAANGRPEIRKTTEALVNGNDFDCDPTDKS